MRITIKKKILGFTIVFVLIFFAVFSFISIYNIHSKSESRIELYRETLLSEKKGQIRNYVQLAINSIEYLSQEEAKKAVKNLKYGKNGYFWIQDPNNFMYSHPDPRLEGKDMSSLKDPNGIYILQEISKVCKENGEGFINYMWKVPGEEKMQPKVSYAKSIPKWNWIVGTGIYIDDVDAMVAKERAKIKSEITSTIVGYVLVSLVMMAALLMLAVLVVKKYITGPIESITQAIKNFNNDLTIKVPVTTNDEIGELSRWFNDHLENLRQIIGMFSDVTKNINTYSGTISTTVGRQVEFAMQLSSSVTEISSTMEEFSSTAVHIANHSRDVVEIAGRTLDQTKEGATVVETLSLKMSEINEDNKINIREIIELGRKSKEINKIMEIINNIANQTKLIAFNAALEAASAGESGKRFGVVAVEIRRLADNVVESTGEIEGKIAEIMEAVNRLVIASEKSTKGIGEGLDFSNHTASMLIDVVDGAGSTTDAAKQISLSTQQQQTASSQVVIALKDIQEGVRISTDSIQETDVVSKNLAELSDRLRSLVEKFKL